LKRHEGLTFRGDQASARKRKPRTRISISNLHSRLRQRCWCSKFVSKGQPCSDGPSAKSLLKRGWESQPDDVACWKASAKKVIS